MTKQEKIKQVYAEYYSECNPDENGWTKWTNSSRFSDLEFNAENNLMRPLSLKGIEDNYGWIKIESYIDLPREKGTTHWVKVGGITMLRKYNDNTLSFWREVTHYKPLEQPKSPIY